MEGIRIDGNNILEVYETIKGVRDYCINNQKPYLVECVTFRMRGHEEASGVKYVPKELMEAWSRKDPIKNYEQYLVSEGVMNEMQVAEIKNEIKDQIEKDLAKAMEPAPFTISIEEELQDVYAPTIETGVQVYQDVFANKDSIGNFQQKRFIEAISDALMQTMERHPEMVIMGQDIAEYGGAFKVTEGFVEKFGKQRVRNTPICESAIVGVSRMEAGRHPGRAVVAGPTLPGRDGESADLLCGVFR